MIDHKSGCVKKIQDNNGFTMSFSVKSRKTLAAFVVIWYAFFEVNAVETGKRIREIRKRAKLTQAEVAEQAGIAINSIRLYEGGKRQPSLEALGKIAAALGVRYFDLLDCGSEMQQGLSSGTIDPEDIAEELNLPVDTVRFVLENLENADAVPKGQRAHFEELRQKITSVGGLLSVELSASKKNEMNYFEKQIFSRIKDLNELGLQKVIDRIDELLEVPKYKKEV